MIFKLSFNSKTFNVLALLLSFFISGLFVQNVQAATYSSNPLNVTLSASPSSGDAPFTDVSLRADVSGNSPNSLITYRFDCNGDDTWEATIQTYSVSYTAEKICNYYSAGSYTARVRVDNNGNTNENRISVSVGNNNNFVENSYHGITVDAGLNKDIGEGKSTGLSGYAYSQYGYQLSYRWACNGGSLSNSYALSPTYYAPPYVSSDTAYTCTLYVTDSRNYSGSDTVNIVVRKSGSYSSDLSIITNKAESITTNSAVIKGTLTGGSGNSAIRFNWGPTIAYGNYTEWSYGNVPGSTVSFTLSNLEKGKTYHYRAEANSGSNNISGEDAVFATKPDSPSNVNAVAISSSDISLSWDKGEGSCSTMVIRKKGSYPLNATDGSVAYYGPASNFNNKNLSSSTTYYYKAWAVTCGDAGVYSYSESPDSKAYAATNAITVASSAKPPEASSQAPVAQISSVAVVLEPLARNITQKETSWQDSINANPENEIEFNIIITPTASSLNNVVVKNKLSNKIGSVSDIKVGSEAYKGSIDSVSVGTIALGTSKIITFKAKVGPATDFNYGDNNIISTAEVSADGITPVSKDLTISVTRGMELGAGLVSFVGNNVLVYSVISIGTFVILLGLICYLLIERKKAKECLKHAHEERATAEPKPEEVEIKKSKYFVIK